MDEHGRPLDPRLGNGRSPRFATTEWGQVLAAGADAGEESRRALELLVGAYWFPLYAQVRRRGYSAEDAEDLTQEFLHQLLEHQRLGRADPARGRFRSFLLASLNHFLSNARAASRTWKRGGRLRFLAITGAESHERWLTESDQAMTPERAFDRHWAMTLLHLVLKRLREEWAVEGQEHSFDRLKPFLTDGRLQPHYDGVAAALGLSEPATRMAVFRLRQRYRLLIREEIARTLEDPEVVDDELQALMAALRETAPEP